MHHSTCITLLNSVINRSNRTSAILQNRQKNLTPRIPPFKVTQCYWKQHGSISHLWLPIG